MPLQLALSDLECWDGKAIYIFSLATQIHTWRYRHGCVCMYVCVHLVLIHTPTSHCSWNEGSSRYTHDYGPGRIVVYLTTRPDLYLNSPLFIELASPLPQVLGIESRNTRYLNALAQLYLLWCSLIFIWKHNFLFLFFSDKVSLYLWELSWN